MTFPTGVDFRKHSDEELTTMLAEAGEASTHARKLGRVMGVVAAHRIKDVKEFLAYQQLATWRRENSLWAEVDALKEAISMPARTPWQKTAEFVDGLKGKLPDWELAEIKRYVEKRCRKEAQAQMTAKPDGTVQYCSPCTPNPDTPSDVCFNLENEGTMSQELEELTPSSAGTGLETPGQQESPPNEGVWENGRITADSILTAGMDSSKEGNISSPMESVETRASQKSTRTATVAGISSTAATPPKRRHKTSSEENKQFDPGGRGEQAPPWKAAVPLPLFSWGGAGRLLVCLSVGSCEASFLFRLCSVFLFSQIIDLSR